MENVPDFKGTAAGNEVADGGPRRQQYGRPPQVEELIDYYLNRRVAALLVQALLPTPLTPNQVSFISMIFSVAAAVCLFFRDVYLAAVAGGLLYVGIVLDCVDGQLARARGGGSLTGRIVDGVCDYLSGIALLVGVCRFIVSTVPAWFSLPIWTLGIMVMLSTILHCALQDHKKLVFLRRLVPGSDEGASTPEAAQRELERAREKRRRLDSLLLRLYLLYGRLQGVFSSRIERPVSKTEPARDMKEASRWELLGMRCWSFLGFATHLFLLVLACFASLVYPPAIFWYLMTVVVLGNVWLVALLLLRV